MKKVCTYFLLLTLISCSSGTAASDESSEMVTVCISPAAHRYHSKTCKGVRACTHELKKMSIADAEEMGKTPCGFCY